MGDRPIRELGNKTPLGAAKTPNFDFLAQNGACGLIEPVFSGNYLTSKDGHLSLFGYNIKKESMGRGVFEAIGVGLKVKKGDVALRGNFATVEPIRPRPFTRKGGANGPGNHLKIVDRRAGRIENTQKLIASLNGITIGGLKFLLKGAIAHRLVVVLRGRGLSEKLSDGDFHRVGIKAPRIMPLVKTKQAQFTAEVLNEFLVKAHNILKEHPLNKQRIKQGLLPANYILVREAGTLKRLPSFQKKWGWKACCVAGGNLYQAIGKVLGMDLIKVPGATGKADTDIKGKFKAAKRALQKYDFCYCHIKATDNFSHDGDFLGKKNFIEKIDTFLPILFGLKNVFIVITGDHATPCKLKDHTGDPVPFLIYPVKSAKGRVGQFKGIKFSEKECEKGGLGKIKSTQLLQILKNFDKIKK